MPAAPRKKASAAAKRATESQASSGSEGTPKPEGATKSHKRSRSGCFTCRLRRKKCDEKHPSCGACSNLCVKCEYKRPIWWGNAEQRKMHKERIKNKIKQTKMNERNGSLAIDPAAHARSLAANSPTSPEFEYGRPFPEPSYDMFASQFPTPAMSQTIYAQQYPYEVDVKTERQTFVNDVQLRHDSISSTFSSFAPPQLNAPLPTFPGDEWFHDEYFRAPALPGIDPALCDQTAFPETYDMLQNIPVSDHDRPLLEHFIHNVLRVSFPVLEAHQRGHLRAQAVLQTLETNKCYLHCCLSVAAIHLKTTEGITGEQIDHDIMRNRFEAISQLCQALGDDTEHQEILDATLAMIFFHSSVGPADDYLPDIPWLDHFQAAANLVQRLGLTADAPNPYVLPPFSMTLTAWIDILGSTMYRRTPEFAHTYRSKHLGGVSLGLRELMGCEDRVMYLISEIACLDALKADGRVDEMQVCSHVSALGQQLEFTEPADPIMESPFSATTGLLRPEILTKNMTAVFRIAARIYLCSLVPGFEANQPSNINLVQALANTLQYIPSGQDGFDRSLVWPLFIAGVYSTPGCQFRTVLMERAAALAEHADLGSFGRMYRVLQEVWRVTDEFAGQCSSLEDNSSSSSQTASPVKDEPPSSPKESEISWTTKEAKKPHWRDIMQQNGWNYLLL
ncbi:Zn(II)2Cys6 transcription factor [Aspergillus mulundensis]|uniref:NosA protein n=1 Tax=Aspergillus mulundensis TaxID=1810919 RepID=A0A3D8S4R1_9EURO|nr:NosA protein [Aspergillus mulundensis]RDW81236.1 NosA protein [Aspergillus mulundensis]